uniref:Uncharacterized protein n=1 Tax=Oryza nivara TaxID=4536 RepID=A0A0E0FX64_ORYNI
MEPWGVFKCSPTVRPFASQGIGSWRILNVATADKTVPADNGISTRIHTPNVTTDTKVGEAQNRKAIAEHV